MADAALTSARFGDADALREALQGAEGGTKDALVNFVQEGTLNTPLHMGTRRQQRRTLWRWLPWLTRARGGRSVRERTRGVHQGADRQRRQARGQRERQHPAAYAAPLSDCCQTDRLN